MLPCFIAIAGPSGSGKTLFAQTIRERVAQVEPHLDLAVIKEDAYYRDQTHLSLEARERVNYDHPDALEQELLRHLDNVLVLNAGDDSGRATAAAADLDVYIEYALEPLRPGHGSMLFGGCADFCVGDGLDAFPTPRRRDLTAPAMVRGKDAVVAGEVDPGLRYERRQTCYEIHRLEGHPCCPVPVRRLQGVDHLGASIAIGQVAS